MLEILKNCKCFIFDFDGTLIDSEPYHINAHNMIMSSILKREVRLDNISFQKYLGKNDEEIYNLFKEENGVDFDINDVVLKKQIVARDLLLDNKVEIFDYFFEIEKLKNKQKKFYILSNQCKMILEDVLKSKKILNKFQRIFCLPEMKISKKYFFENFSKYIKDVDFCDIVIFEDSASTIDVAHELGMKTIGIETKMNEDKIKNSDYLIKI